MAGRVLSSESARTAVQGLKQVITGTLPEQIAQLRDKGNTLSQPDVWDGNLAQQFRAQWPEHQRAIEQMRATLDELQQSVDRITQDIMSAGGN